MSAPAFIATRCGILRVFSSLCSGLGNKQGWCEVDQFTLQHVKHRNIFSLGDASSLPLSKTAAAIASQLPVASANLMHQLTSDHASNVEPGSTNLPDGMIKYDGYTSCPLVTGHRKLVLAEFNGYTLQPHETFWFDQSKESESMYWLKSEVSFSFCILTHIQFLPRLYWHQMLPGNWNGPQSYRKLFNPRGVN